MTGRPAILLACALAAACARAPEPPAHGRAQIRVAAAADLNAALGELIARFAASHAADVSASYGSSGTFFAQLTNGAPYDLFLSADLGYPRRLIERGLADPDSAFTYGVGRLVLWVPGASALDLAGGLRGLTAPAVTRIAIANPAHVPYGRAAEAALQSAGVLDAVRPRLVLGENVAQALQFAQSGAADAAIVALSLALAAPADRAGRWVEIPADSYPRIDQGGVIMKHAVDADAARAFRDYLLGAEGRATLARFGFAPAER